MSEAKNVLRLQALPWQLSWRLSVAHGLLDPAIIMGFAEYQKEGVFKSVAARSDACPAY